MNCERNERIGYYITMAMEASCEEIAKQYDRLDTADIHPGRRLDRLVYRAIAKAEGGISVTYRPSPRRRAMVMVAVIVTLLALLLSVSVAATQGTAVWNAVVNWYEDHISINFGQNADMDGGIETAPSVYITENRLPRGRDFGLLQVNYGFDIQQYRWAKYGYANDKGEVLCFFWQAAWVYSLDPADLEVYEQETVSVGEYTGVLYTDGKTDKHILLWDDGEYRYRLESVNFDVSTMIAMAESVEAGRGMMPENTLQGTYLPTVLPQGVEQKITMLDPFTLRVQYIWNGEMVCEYMQHPLHKNIDSESHYGKVVGFFGINGYIGKAVMYPNGGGTLSWQDDKNGYILWSVDASFEELVQIARSVRYVGTAAAALQEIHLIKNMQENVTWKMENQTESSVRIGYYRDGERIARLYQQTIVEALPEHRGDAYTVEHVSLHYRSAILRRYESGLLALVFYDGAYQYILESDAVDETQLHDWAASISPPKTVEQPLKPDGLPATWTKTSEEYDLYAHRYTYADGGQEVLAFTQQVLWGASLEYDKDCEAEDVFLGTRKGVLLRYRDGRLLLVWNDGSYLYEMSSYFLTAQELVSYAGRLTTVDLGEASGCPTYIEEIRKPQKGFDGLQEVVVETTATGTVVEYRQNGEVVGKFTQRVYGAEPIWVRDNIASLWIRVVDGRLQYRYIHEDNRNIHNWTDGEYQYTLETIEGYHQIIDPMVANTR